MTPVTSRQEAFDRVWKHFITDKGPIGRGPNEEGCSLWHPCGARCAIGVLMPVKEAKRLQEGSGPDLANTAVPQIFSSLPDNLQALGIEFLRELQQAHDMSNIGPDDCSDHSAFRQELREQLTKLAIRFGLRVPQ